VVYSIVPRRKRPGGCKTWPRCIQRIVKILISNDDGYRADGLSALTQALAPLADITVVAPDRNRSGASNSLTLDMPLRVLPFDERRYYVVNGTPTDCVHLAISGLFDEEHDMVVSGINDGANLGDDVLYSGTVAAAIEGRFLGLPAIAISLVTQPNSAGNFACAARVASELVMRVQRTPLHQATILNVNVPDVPYEALQGYAATRLGFRHRSERILRSEDPRGRPVYWVGPAGAGQDAGPGTDFHAVANNCVSVTPLQIDLTRHSMLDDISDWLQGRPA
jgi:5'-nucleotidase